MTPFHCQTKHARQHCVVSHFWILLLSSFPSNLQLDKPQHSTDLMSRWSVWPLMVKLFRYFEERNPTSRPNWYTHTQIHTPLWKGALIPCTVRAFCHSSPSKLKAFNERPPCLSCLWLSCPQLDFSVWKTFHYVSSVNESAIDFLSGRSVLSYRFPCSYF